jgi:hypothetical protein
MVFSQHPAHRRRDAHRTVETARAITILARAHQDAATKRRTEAIIELRSNCCASATTASCTPFAA